MKQILNTLKIKIKQATIKKILFYSLFFITVQTSAQNDSISLGTLFKNNKIQSITVIDSSKIQFFLTDTTINGLNYFESKYSDKTIDLIRSRQLEVYDSVKIKPYYMNRTDTAYIMSWVIPIFFLLLLWIPGLLAIIYFIRSGLRIELKILIVALLVIVPISGIIIYPLRFKIYRD